MAQGYDAVIGIDEVGMGALAGPVVACAVMLAAPFYTTRHRELARLRDSKLLAPHQRELFARRLQDHSLVRYAIGSASVREVDRLNVLGASRRAMYRAIAGLNLAPNLRVMVLIDGNKLLPEYVGDQRAVVRGDQSVVAIAAASVIAKVDRDARMVRYAAKYPAYGFDVHKGYGTAAHQRALRTQGLCGIHRVSFRIPGSVPREN